MKKLFKTLANVLAGILVAPCVALYWVGSAVMGRQKAFAGWSQGLALWPGLSGVYLRRAFYRFVLPKVGADACLCFGTVISHPTARFGRKVYVGTYCVLGDVTLEDDVLLGSQVSVMNGAGQHGIERLDTPIREQPGVWPRVTIGRDTWVGDRAVIMADVGAHCVIGAGSVVSKPLPDYAIAVGNPARIVRFRNEPQVDEPQEDERERNVGEQVVAFATG